MRCPKCSYISFDNTTACPKCRQDLIKTVAQLHGTTMRVQPPNFLGPALLALAARARAEEAAASFSLPEAAPQAAVAEGGPDLDLRLEQTPETADIEMAAPAAIIVDEQPDLDLQGLTVEEKPAPEAEAETVIELPDLAMAEPAGGDESPAPVSLQLEGLDLSDLSPESSVKTTPNEQETGEDEGLVFDMWSLDTDSADSDAAVGVPSGDDLLEDLLHHGKPNEEVADIDLGVEEVK